MTTVHHPMQLSYSIDAQTPSIATKQAYSGEFDFLIREVDEDGNDVGRRVTVPWTTIKEIMAAIRKQARLAADIMECNLCRDPAVQAYVPKEGADVLALCGRHIAALDGMRVKT